MKITVNNDEFYDFLLYLHNKEKEKLMQMRKMDDAFDDLYQKTINEMGFFSRFLNRFWFDEAYQTTFETLPDWKDIFQIKAQEKKVDHVLDLCNAFQYITESDLTKTTEIEYDSYVAKQYIKYYNATQC